MNKSEVHVVMIGGNFFDAANYLNEKRLGGYLIQMTHVGGYVQSVLVMPSNIATAYKEKGVL